jgi:tetratricopeptide (TPR) repeat protein
MSTDNVPAAYDALRDLVASTSDLPDAHNLLGEIYFHELRYQDLRRAAEHFEKALEADPAFTRVLHHLIYLDRARGDPEQIERRVANLAKEQPGSPLVIRARAESLLARGRPAEAIALLDRVSIDRSYLRDLILEAYMLSGQWNLAIASIEELWPGNLKDAPGNVRWWRAKARIGLGELRAAIDDMHSAATYFRGKEELQESGLGIASCTRAAIHSAAGQIDLAEEAVRQALEDVPHWGEAYYGLGVIQLQDGQVDAARESLSRLVHLGKSVPRPAPTLWAHLLGAEIHLADGNVAGARTELDAATAISDRMGATLYVFRWTRARVEAAAGNRDAALQVYGELLAPTFGPYFGWDAVLRIRALYESARLEETIGDRAAARDHYRAFLDAWGEADIAIPDVEDARRRLAALDAD